MEAQPINPALLAEQVEVPGVALPQAAPMPVPAVPAIVPFQSASLYVGDLHPDVTEALLYDIFNAVGPVASIRVCRDAVTRRSLGYAYVNFHNTQDAERALDTMNYTLIKDRPCRMMWSQRDPSLRRNGAGNVFVKHLDLSIDNKALYDTFSLFGNILSCKVVTDLAGKSRGYGFVHFETVEAAEEAIKKINGMLIAGKEVYVGRFLKKDERPSQKEWTNIYVKNIPKDWGTFELEQFFSTCGEIVSSIIMSDDNGESKGFGFVDFAENESAVRAIDEFDGFEFESNGSEDDIEGVAFDVDKENEGENKDVKGAEGEGKGKSGGRPKTGMVVCRAQKKTERERDLAQRFEDLKIERQSRYQGVNLYVKNVDERVDDDLLRKEFELFGNITSARVMRDRPTVTPEGKKPGASKGFGFVCFSAPEEAIRAVTEMNGKLLLGKPIYVALAQRKEQRRAQLEAQHRQQQRMMNMPGMPGGPINPAMFPYNTSMNPQMPTQPMYPRFNPQLGLMPSSSQPEGPPRGIPQQFQGRPPMREPINGPGALLPGQAVPNLPPQRAMPRGVLPQQQQQSIPGGQRGVQFNQNARNTQMMHPQQLAGAMPRGVPMQAVGVGNMAAVSRQQAPLNAADLASASPEQRKTMIGEKLYPMISRIEPTYAGKITGMLLEMDNSELLHLLESRDSLVSRVKEAMDVLNGAQM